MQTVEIGDWTNPRLCQSIKLANVNGIQSADIIRFYEGEQSWLGLFEQFFRFDKWNACRVQAAAICDSRLK
jgi:hypothetical protein